jgi:hypothetical protein
MHEYMPDVSTMQKVIANETLVASAITTSLLIMVAIEVGEVDIITIYIIVVIISWCLRLPRILVLI